VRERGEDEPLYESDWGGGISLMIGKEWWVSDNWGLGIAGQLFGGSAKDKDDEDLQFDTFSVNLCFSATYN
jgi:hypothetical protein